MPEAVSVSLAKDTTSTISAVTNPDEISIVFATRNRPHNLRRFHQSLCDTAQTMPEVCLYIDHDDTLSVPVAKELGFKYVQGPRQFIMHSMNMAYYLATGNIIMYTGDDCPFREKDWDTLVKNEFSKVSDKIVLVYGSDGGQDWCASHGFIHRRWVETVGYFLPPYRYADQWITKVAELLDRKVKLPQMLAEHMHHTHGKDPIDEVYKESSVGMGPVILNTFKVDMVIENIVEKLKKAMR